MCALFHSKLVSLGIRKTTTSYIHKPKINTLTRLLFSYFDIYQAFFSISSGISNIHTHTIYVCQPKAMSSHDWSSDFDCVSRRSPVYNHRENKRVQVFACLIEVQWLNSNTLFIWWVRMGVGLYIVPVPNVYIVPLIWKLMW